MSKNNCLFQVRWRKDERFKHWIRKENDNVTICNYCCKYVLQIQYAIIALNMEEAAVIHERQKHVELTRALND